MRNYVIKRLLLIWVTASIIVFLVFVFIKLLPQYQAAVLGVDPEIRIILEEQEGYGKPVVEQFFIWIQNMVREGGLGRSLKLKRDEREKKIEMEKDDLGNKPKEIKEKIVEGRIQKKLKEMVLLEQAFIRDSSITVDDLVKKNISTLGENIQIRRFERFVLGEGLEKKNENFSDEVEKMMK